MKNSGVYLTLLAMLVMFVLLIDPYGLGTWIWNSLISIDQLGNALLGGDPDETISSRLGRWLSGEYGSLREAVAQVVCGALNLIDEDHCILSVGQ